MSNDSPTSAVSYYQPHKKLYPREVSGRFTRLRRGAVVALLGIYYVLPWVRWEGHQGILFDLPARKFHIFGLTFWPQDFFYLTWLLVIAALTLFFVTALAGRLWCGYACPQTVWTEVFIWMERLTEGNRSKRIKLDKAPWSMQKVWRKTAKQLLWITFSAFTGFTFVGYFTPVTELWRNLLLFELGPWQTFWIVFYGFATYGNAGYLREQVCEYMCPYARFQSAMFDDDSLIVSYDVKRGEPRGRRRRRADHRSMGLGDCINCHLCVQVCPTGIDIRDGLQYECIACAACVDACDNVMDDMGYARGLVRYSTEHAITGQRSRILRPRVFVYGVLLLALVTGFIVSIAGRTPLEFDVIRDRNALYREIGPTIENVYTLKIVNKDHSPHLYVLTASGLPDLELDLGVDQILVESGSVVALPVRVRVPREQLAGGAQDIVLELQSMDRDDLNAARTTRFISPVGLR